MSASEKICHKKENLKSVHYHGHEWSTLVFIYFYTIITDGWNSQEVSLEVILLLVLVLVSCLSVFLSV